MSNTAGSISPIDDSSQPAASKAEAAALVTPAVVLAATSAGRTAGKPTRAAIRLRRRSATRVFSIECRISLNWVSRAEDPPAQVQLYQAVNRRQADPRRPKGAW